MPSSACKRREHVWISVTVRNRVPQCLHELLLLTDRPLPSARILSRQMLQSPLPQWRPSRSGILLTFYSSTRRVHAATHPITERCSSQPEPFEEWKAVNARRRG